MNSSKPPGFIHTWLPYETVTYFFIQYFCNFPSYKKIILMRHVYLSLCLLDNSNNRPPRNWDFPRNLLKISKSLKTGRNLAFRKRFHTVLTPCQSTFLDRLELRQWWWVGLYLDSAHLIMHSSCLLFKTEPHVCIPKMRMETRSY